MYLTNIKALGFKSFADKINIEMDKGITGIVGPNGSGKSNVVDAVRWVLGEQSVKSLRGEGNMTDVIFSGSKSRSAANSASVTLTFDNSDHYLPMDFSEIAIKRTVYNTGENEYNINGEKCRLKDIVNLFTDSGIGKESFSIISQGSIGEILSNKPEDRRVVFEDAAEVLKYKKRKEEAIRKLDKTHDNMNRINDIIKELEIQIAPLKEQSEKAQKYEELKKQLENMEIALIAKDITDYNFEYQHNLKKLDELNTEILNLEANSSLEDANLIKDKNNLLQIDSELSLKQGELVKITSEVERLAGQKQLILERQKYQDDDPKLHDNLASLKEQELKIANDIHNIISNITDKKSEVNAIDSLITKLEEKQAKKLSEKNKVVFETNGFRKKHLELVHQSEVTLNSIENNSLLTSTVKSVINNPKLNGIHDAIGNLIDTNEEYTISIDTALGGSIQFVVVDNEQCAKHAISYLKSNNLGRITFFPLNIITPKGIEEAVLNKIARHPNYIDIAANLVTYDPRYRNIILNQLGNVIVVRDIDSANEISKLINYRYKIVTLDGEIIHVGGSITGGNQRRRISILSEKYAYENMLKEIDLISNKIKDYEEVINQQDYDINEIETKAYSLKQERLTLIEIINNKELSLRDFTERKDKITNELAGINDVLNNTLSKEEQLIMEEYYQRVNEKDKVMNFVDKLVKQKHFLNDTISEKEKSLKFNNTHYTKKQKDLHNLEIQNSRLDVKLDTLLNALNEEYSMTYEKAKNDYILDLDVDLARVKVNETKNSIRDLGVVNVLAINEYERVNTRYTFLLNQKNDLISAEDALLEIIKEMDETMKIKFEKTFNLINEEFKLVFKKLFSGGEASLVLTDPQDLLTTGVEIKAQPPGKKLQHISLLSGGEKTLTAISLLFAILNVRPVPFCLLDEVEAALDEVNVDRFGKYIHEYKNKTQFILITHKKKTMEYVDNLYGITMQESGVSKLVSVKLEGI